MSEKRYDVHIMQITAAQFPTLEAAVARVKAEIVEDAKPRFKVGDVGVDRTGAIWYRLDTDANPWVKKNGSCGSWRSDKEAVERGVEVRFNITDILAGYNDDKVPVWIRRVDLENVRNCLSRHDYPCAVASLDRAIAAAKENNA